MENIKYTHIIKPGLKNIYIRIGKNGEVVLKCSPSMQKESIEFLHKKLKWIEKTLQRLKDVDIRQNIYKNDGCVWFLGKKYPLVFIRHDKKRAKLSFDNEKFYFYHIDSSEECEKSIDKFYKQEAKRLFVKRVEYYSEKMGLYPKDIKFRKTKRRLGSCTYDDILTFNYLAVKLSVYEIDYIVVHELAHIKEKNHSKDFWEIVSQEFPNYKDIRKNITLSL